MQNNDNIYSTIQSLGFSAVQRGMFQFFKISQPSMTFSIEQQRKLLAIFCKMTTQLHEVDMGFCWMARDDYFANINSMLLVFRSENLVGFAMTQLFEGCGERIIYIRNMCITKIPGKVFGPYSIGSLLVNEILADNFSYCLKPRSVVFRTQSTTIYRIGYSMLPRGIFPRVNQDQARQEDRSLRISQFMARAISPDKPFMAEFSIIKNAYEKCIYGSHSTNNKTQRKEIKAFWEANVDMNNGDAVLISICPYRREYIAAVGLYLFNILQYKVKFFLRRRSNSKLRINRAQITEQDIK